MMNKKDWNNYKQVRDEWYGKLKQDGFHDIESSSRNRNGRQFKERTVTNRNALLLSEFYWNVTMYLNDEVQTISPSDYTVLCLWSEGIQHKHISNKTLLSVRKIKRTVGQYKKIILGWSEKQKELEEE